MYSVALPVTFGLFEFAFHILQWRGRCSFSPTSPSANLLSLHALPWQIHSASLDVYWLSHGLVVVSVPSPVLTQSVKPWTVSLQCFYTSVFLLVFQQAAQQLVTHHQFPTGFERLISASLNCTQAYTCARPGSALHSFFLSLTLFFFFTRLNLWVIVKK